MKTGVKRMYYIVDDDSGYTVKKKKTRVYALVGAVGSGKTFWATALALYYKRRGYAVYANIELSGELEGAVSIKDTSFVDVVPKDGSPKFVLVDEVGVGGKSVHQLEFIKTMTLVRKLVGEDSVIVMTTPLAQDIERRLKGHVDALGRPVLLERNGWVADAILYFHDKVERGGFNIGFSKSPTRRKFLDSFGVEVEDVFECFETGEKAEGLRDGTYIQIFNEFRDFEFVDKESGKRISVPVLATIIRNRFNIPLSRAKEYAQCLLWGYDPTASS